MPDQILALALLVASAVLLFDDLRRRRARRKLGRRIRQERPTLNTRGKAP